MPRAGSPPPPPDYNGPPEPMNVGEIADPPFAVLPEPQRVFANRAERLEQLASGHDLEAYLRFLAALTRVQGAIIADLPPPFMPPDAQLEQGYEHGMPPISVGRFVADGVLFETIDRLLDGFRALDVPAASLAAIEAVRKTTPDNRAEMAQAVLLGAIPEGAVAEHVLVAAALQVHFARMAARLDAGRMTRVADSACPSCGSSPVASAIVGWTGAANTRFCCCSICATHWHVVRIRCLVCGSDEGIAYQSIEGGNDLVKAETCDSCHSYVKILHQHKDATLEPLADDVASLGLDLLLRDEGYHRAAANPFLLGY
jgi:FdhE protein